MKLSFSPSLLVNIPGFACFCEPSNGLEAREKYFLLLFILPLRGFCFLDVVVLLYFRAFIHIYMFVCICAGMRMYVEVLF